MTGRNTNTPAIQSRTKQSGLGEQVLPVEDILKELVNYRRLKRAKTKLYYEEAGTPVTGEGKLYRVCQQELPLSPVRAEIEAKTGCSKMNVILLGDKRHVSILSIQHSFWTYPACSFTLVYSGGIENEKVIDTIIENVSLEQDRLQQLTKPDQTIMKGQFIEIYNQIKRIIKEHPGIVKHPRVRYETNREQVKHTPVPVYDNIEIQAPTGELGQFWLESGEGGFIYITDSQKLTGEGVEVRLKNASFKVFAPGTEMKIRTSNGEFYIPGFYYEEFKKNWNRRLHRISRFTENVLGVIKRELSIQEAIERGAKHTVRKLSL